MLAVYKKELKSYFTSVIGWVFIAFFLIYGIQSDEWLYGFFTGIQWRRIVLYPAFGAGSYDAYYR